jgi:hypothetical protein
MVAASGCKDRLSAQIGRAEVLLAGRGERLVGALEDSLRADVDPAPGGHLAEHRQPERLEPAELLPGRPPRNQKRVGDENARRPGVRPKDADRLPALNQERLVFPQREQRADERFEGLVVTRGLAGAAVDDEFLWLLRHLGIEVVQQHP